MSNNNDIYYLPEGIILEDITKKKWILGKSVGSGGFGLIYDVISISDTVARCIAKIEYKESGALFCEINFYNRVVKNIRSMDMWKEYYKISHLGVPRFYGFGIFTYRGIEYRFLVIEKLGSDLDKLLIEKKKFNIKGIKTIVTNILTILEFIHDNGFSHGDVKASNILLGLDSNRIYLVDYGLSSRYSIDGKHRLYLENPNNRHNGTLLFTSIDAHKGVNVSRRGDLESLGYCMLEWYTGTLPWIKCDDEPIMVQKEKEKFIGQIQTMNDGKDAIITYLKYVTSLGYMEKPDYGYLKSLFL
ncbi:Ser/Thr protein kinase [Turkeypox virus]|uniref:non-specific serine/threonine protein kinase n=1 Tax=Turkeypox virus TaxID=336486 RepID=A0A0M3ZJR1_9POXV|nr:Ser/Thr protein kinase [Turkeypox virus]ALA62528.1 Ser/Thr protein kinase [Turkeypox virus]